MGWFSKRRDAQNMEAFVEMGPKLVAFAGMSSMGSEFDLDLYKWGLATDYTQSPGGEHIKQSIIYLVDATRILGAHWQRLGITNIETIFQLTDARQLPVPESAKAVIRLILAELERARAMHHAAGTA
jgi:hypothetical protein